jgi:hypothetical protein
MRNCINEFEWRGDAQPRSVRSVVPRKWGSGARDVTRPHAIVMFSPAANVRTPGVRPPRPARSARS